MALSESTPTNVWTNLTETQLTEMKAILLKNFDYAAKASSDVQMNPDHKQILALTATAIIQLENFVQTNGLFKSKEPS